MKKELIIDIVWKDDECDKDNCIQGLFENVDEAISTLKERFNIDDIDYYIISENSVNGLEEIYDSQNIITTI